MPSLKEYALHMAALNAQPDKAHDVVEAAQIYEKFLTPEAMAPVEVDTDLRPDEVNDIVINSAAKAYAGFKGIIWDKITETERKQMAWAAKQILLAAKNAPKADV